MRKSSVLWYPKDPGKLKVGSADRPFRLTSGFRNHPARGTPPSKINPLEKIAQLFSMTKKKDFACVVIYG